MSREETAKTTCVCDGNCLSIFFVWRNCGSLLEKKKFSSTTGLRSTKAATSPKSTAVSNSIHQCAPTKPGLVTISQSLRHLGSRPIKLGYEFRLVRLRGKNF